MLMYLVLAAVVLGIWFFVRLGLLVYQEFRFFRKEYGYSPAPDQVPKWLLFRIDKITAVMFVAFLTTVGAAILFHLLLNVWKEQQAFWFATCASALLGILVVARLTLAKE